MRLRTILLSLLSILVPTAAADAGPSSAAMAARRIDEYLSRLSKLGFSGSALVASKDDVELARGYGLADRNEAIPATASTVYPIGSITKSMTATAILDLIEEERLELTSSVGRYFPDAPADKKVITIEQLLTHTSGLGRSGNGGDYALGATRDAVLEEIWKEPLKFEPGTSHSYSNLGYSLLAMIIELVSGKPYEEFLRQRIFLPAHMYRTGYLLPRYQSSELATGYRGDKEIGSTAMMPALPDGPTWNLRGNGGIQSNAFDLLRWIRALDGHAVLSGGATEMMLEPRVEIGDEVHYAYGWEIRAAPDGTRLVGHRGGNGYFASDLRWSPDHGTVIFIVTNEESQVNMERLSRDLVSLLFGNTVVLPPDVKSVSPEWLQSLAGAWTTDDGAVVEVLAHDDRLTIRASDRAAIAVVLGGEYGLAEPSVKAMALRTARILESEFDGDFRPKFDAMRGAASIGDLQRYHAYDRERWETEFGSFQGVEIISAAGTGDTVEVIAEIEFLHGSAVEVYRWEGATLKDIRVIPDLAEFVVSRDLYPVGPGVFESFSPATPLRSKLEIDSAKDSHAIIHGGGRKIELFPVPPTKQRPKS